MFTKYIVSADTLARSFPCGVYMVYLYFLMGGFVVVVVVVVDVVVVDVVVVDIDSTSLVDVELFFFVIISLGVYLYNGGHGT